MEKLKNMFKDKNKRFENLVAFLIILIITLIIINNIIKDDDENVKEYDYSEKELAISNSFYSSNEDNLEKRLEKILSKISGVSDVSVLITYSSSCEIIPVYNEKNSTSITEEIDTSGGKRTIEAEDIEKTIVSGSDANPVTKQTVNPCIEGAIVTAKGVNNSNIKANVISAVEAVTGLATHKIQVFESGN